MKKLIAVIVLLYLPVTGYGARVDVEGMRMWPAPESTRVVFDISGPVDYKLFRLENPHRVVVDLKNVHLQKSLSEPSGKDNIMKDLRYAPRHGSDLRVVFDLHEQSKFKSFLLKPNEEYGHRLVIDLFRKDRATQPVKRSRPSREGPRDIVVAIDAGHGGEDPGARGYSGVYEKDVVLAIARRLERLLEREPGLRPFMTRDGDYYISLRKRTLKARRAKADLFVSIHADAFRDRRVRGMSLYVLSRNGASDEAARWLAEKENASDLIGGVSLDDKDNLLASVLLDLSQTAAIESSFAAGNSILDQMRPLGKMHKRSVQQAGFAVLKSPDVPSLLIETAFISNPRDERRLRDARHQQKIARALLEGIKLYFYEHPPAGTLYAATRRHVIERGDTLSELAMHYRVSISTLRSVNRLKSDVLRVGQVLRIPGGSEG